MSVAAALRLARGAFTLDLDLAVTAGRTLALLGPNGAGKSTALGLLAGTIDLDSGSVVVNGRVLDDESTHVETEHRRIGVVFQDYLLFPHLSVLENVAFGPRSSGIPRAAARSQSVQWLDRLGIADLASTRPPQLSGGQAQRVALGRALASNPELLLLDEPLAALDVEVREEVRGELGRFIHDWGGPTIVVTHLFDDVVALADDVVVIERGRATQRATVRELVQAPATSYVSRLVASWSDD
ncbi:ATP-binding cassette domain-containing protein [Salinibacterium sp. G-O1]|uniref:ATP-binding cassette domain-containing protein n=1 Tax=Salinibacterium sp. G-O1 TaxID=3046208 RepID=UPI0024BA8164|nr:ATP-binding cassette domain-containing protein [Salinibacterium sp. G-O1]MDJ0335837.1 ATP-binding cassette domain-containing protein [Salinibacterium sp. G-O1]